MSADLSEFYQVFYEEAGELLANMEQLLLGMDLDGPDLENLNAVFRVAHSIKGGAATFGFTDIVEVTHMLESLLDQIRKGEKRLRSDMVDVFLTAGDVVKGQLAGHRGDGQADPAGAADVCARLKGFLAAGDAPPPAVPGPAVPPAQSAATVASSGSFRVEFKVDGLPAETATLVSHVIGGLESLGKLSFSRGGRAGGEVVSENGRQLQIFDTCLATSEPEEEVWEVLAFNLDPASINITSAGAADGAALSASPGVSAETAEHGFLQQLYEAVVPSAPDAPAPVAAVPKPPAALPPRGAGRRDSDDPDASVVRAGRRDDDKVAVSAGDASSIRVSIEKVDLLINLVGELVIAEAMLVQSASRIDPAASEALLQGVDQLARSTRDLQEAVMSIRMMPIGFVFSRFPRVVRDLAARLNKQVELKTVGEGTELDKGLVERISDPLTHLVRNSLDHGIELPGERVAKGKPEKGTITLRACHQGGAMVIEVVDDGAGLHRQRILEKARERGLPVSEGMPDGDVWQLIFEAGFSTAEKVTELSGRGVGMDVVKRNIQALGGKVEIESTFGVGTRISIRVPLTLAILDGMSVAVGGEVFIIPLSAIVESLQPRRSDVKSVQGQGRMVQVRGEFLPVVALDEVFGIRSRVAGIEQAMFVILETDGMKKAVLVDELLGQHQVVIKSLETNYRKTPGVSGATIMGDGRVALILDVATIIGKNTGGLRAAA